MTAFDYICTHVLGMPYAELARALGVTRSTVSKWASGERNPPLHKLGPILERMARERALPFSNDWLFRPPACEHCPNLPDTVCADGCARIIAQCAAIRAASTERTAADGSGGDSTDTRHAPPSATAPACVTGQDPAAIPAAAPAPRQEAA